MDKKQFLTEKERTILDLRIDSLNDSINEALQEPDRHTDEYAETLREEYNMLRKLREMTK